MKMAGSGARIFQIFRVATKEKAETVGKLGEIGSGENQKTLRFQNAVDLIQEKVGIE